MTGVARDAMQRLKEMLKDDVLAEPLAEEYAAKLLEPYGTLLGMLYVVDTVLQKGRIEVLRDTFHQML